MRPSLLLPFAALAFAAAPISAQANAQLVTPGQAVTGRLESTDPKLDDGSFFDLFLYLGQPGDRIVVTLRSSDFDAYLSGGLLNGTTFQSQDTDDDGDGGTDSKMTVTVGPSGRYAIRANSLEEAKTGAYSLRVELVSGPSAGGSAQSNSGSGGPSNNNGGSVRTITAGQTVRASLTSSDPKLDDDSHYHTYTYRGRPGEQIVITMRSEDFDTYLAGGPGSGGDFDDTDDDGAGGTDSRLTVTLGSDGTYTIHANTLAADETGDYSLTLQSAAASASGSALRSGDVVNGELVRSDPTLSDDSHYKAYTYQGRAGERLLITLTSDDFDAFLHFGRMQGTSFTSIETNDDDAGGTNSRIQVTLPTDGVYTIRANAYDSDGLGDFTLAVELDGASTVSLPTVTIGQTVNGRLETTDKKMSDNSYYKLYTYRGRAGEQVMVTLRSRDFDAYLGVGQMVGSEFEADEHDDDSGGGTDSQVIATVGDGGVLVIQANTLRADETGAFSISVEAIGTARPGGSAPAPQAPAPAGQRTLGTGQQAQGRLARTDPMLSDSSNYQQFVYQGRPGDRVRITMRSTEFNPYVRWGRVTGNTFDLEASDDNSGGGTTAQLDVVVGGSGTYVIQANAFTPGEVGAYTLSVESVAANTPSAPAPGPSAPAPAPNTPRPGGTTAPTTPTTAAGGGKWVASYEPTANPTFTSLGNRIKNRGVLTQIADVLNSRFASIREVVPIHLDECDGDVNAFWSPRDRDITFCYELVDVLADMFVADGQWNSEQMDNIDGTVRFVMLHEVGHALVDLFDLPVLGREEDVADQLAVYVLAGAGDDKSAQAAVNGAEALVELGGSTFDDSDYADEHSLGPQRLYNVLCWVYGSNPQKYAGIVTSGDLPRDRAVRCPGEWQQLSKAWQRLLEPHGMQFLPGGGARTRPPGAGGSRD